MKYIITLVALLWVQALVAQQTLTNKDGSKYQFTEVVNHEALPVQNQSITGTCWSFSALSFLESEMMRMGKEPENLAEMFIVHKAYQDKAERYIRMHGKTNFGAGGAFHDIPYVVGKYGIVPEDIFPGLEYGKDAHDHRELNAVLEAMVKVWKSNPAKQLSPAWSESLQAVLDTYLGRIPEQFEYKGKQYTPKSYAQSLGLNMDDYVEISSYTHHPFYSKFVLEVPDNWMWSEVYNVPMNDMMTIIDNALEQGYTIAWAADVSEKGFSFSDGLALLPADEGSLKPDEDGVRQAFTEPVEEVQVTQEMRQQGFNNFQTTDDHGMHITGMYKDQDGTKYYFVKNSWGTGNDRDGYLFVSEAYVKAKTMDIMVHKDAIPGSISRKLQL
jgi:bleomycin hydrolase